MVNKWMQKAFSKHKGELHKQLHVPEGKPIPKAKLEKATHSKDMKLRKRAIAAKTASKISKKRSKRR